MQVDRAGVDRGEGALGLDLADHLARGGVDDREAVGGGRAQRDPAGDEVARPRSCSGRRRPCAARPSSTRRSAASRQPSPRISSSSRPPSGCLVGGGDQVLHLDLLGAVVEDRRLDRPLEELVGVAAEELVERVLAGDVDGEPAAPAPGAAPHLAQAGDGAGEVDADRRVELADVDARAPARWSPRRRAARPRRASASISRRCWGV